MEMAENLLKYIPNGPASCKYRRFPNLRIRNNDTMMTLCYFCIKASKVRIYAELKLQLLRKSPGMMADKKTYMTWMSNLTNDILLSEAITGMIDSDSGTSNNCNPSADGDYDEFIFETLDAYSIELPLFKEKSSPTAPEIANDGNTLHVVMVSDHGVPATAEVESTKLNQMSEYLDWTKNDAHNDHPTLFESVPSTLKDECRSAEKFNKATDIDPNAITFDDRNHLIGNSTNFVQSTSSEGVDLDNEEGRIGEGADLPACDDCSLNGNESFSIATAPASAARCSGSASCLQHSVITVPVMGTRSASATSSTAMYRSNGGQTFNSTFGEVDFSGSWCPSSAPVIPSRCSLPRHAVEREISFSTSDINDSPLSVVGTSSSTCARPSQTRLPSDQLLCSSNTFILNADPSSSSAMARRATTRQYQYPSGPLARESVDLSSITFQVIHVTLPNFTFCSYSRPSLLSQAQ